MFMWKTRCYAENFRNYLLIWHERWSEDVSILSCWEFHSLFAQLIDSLLCRNNFDSLNFFLPQLWSFFILRTSPTCDDDIIFIQLFFFLLSVNPENSSTSNAHIKNDLAIKLREEKLGNFVISHKLIGKSFPIFCLRDGRRFVWESVGAWMMNWGRCWKGFLFVFA